MISTGQYPTVIDWSTQNFEATELITSLNISDPELTESYWLGWVAYDNLPSVFKISRQVIDEDARTMSFVDVTRPENVDLAIVTPAFLASTPNINNPYTAVYDGDVWRRFDSIASGNFAMPSTNSRFVNKFDVNTLDISNTYVVINLVVDDTNNAYTLVTLTPTELYDRHFTRTITVDDITNVSGSPLPSDLSSFDISDSMLDGTLQTVTAAGHTIKFFAGAFGISGFGRPLVVGGASRGNYYNPLPVVRLHDSDEHTFLIGGSRFFAMSSGWLNGGYRIAPSTGAINGYDFYDSATRSMIGGFAGTVSLDDVAALASNYGIISATKGNFVVQGVGRADVAFARRMYTWYEIITTLSYMMRYHIELTYNTDSNKYYPAISDTNEFMGYLLNGEADRDKLRPWQISGTALDTESNEYTPADKPPYIPSEGDDTKNKIGDRIGWNFTNLPAGNATGLYTLYALTQDHVSRLGAKLWATLNNGASNFWSNLVFAQSVFAETGSLDIRDVLDFIVSLRIYPIALDQLSGWYNSGAPAIRIGSGRVALNLDSGVPNTGIMGRYTVALSGGAVYVPSHYGDFRDIDGVSTTVYIPYIGNININTSEVVGCTLNLSYLLDLTSGNLTAYLLVLSNDGYYPIGIYHGTVGADIPLNASQGNGVFLRSIARATMGATSLVASGGDPVSMIRMAGGMVGDLAGGGQTPNTLNAGATNFSGFAAPQVAYLQIRRRKYAYTARNFPADQMGRRTYGVKGLGTLSGFTVCDAVDVSGIPAPADIQTDIKKALETGVYL